jgi:DNA-binding response OmpR family regulator
MAILHLDDNELIRDVVRRALGASGFSVVSADSVRAAQLALAERDDIAGALLDVRLRDGSGVDVYWWIATHRPALAKRVAFLSGSAGTEAFAPLAALGCPILPKPFELADLRRFAAEWEAAADPSAQPR